MTQKELQTKSFLLLLILISLAFGWVIWPYLSVIFCAIVLAIMFAPIKRYLMKKLPNRENLVAFLTVLLVLVMVILPLSLVTTFIVQEGARVYQKLQSGELNINVYFERAVSALPTWISSLLDRIGIGTMGDLQEKLSQAMMAGSKFMATQALNIGQMTFEFAVNFGIMLYLLFFIVRDSDSLSNTIIKAIPLEPSKKQELFSKFITVIRATVKGNLIVAIVQGALGGLIFWILGIQAALLWAVLMAFLSLIPAVGAGLVWAPVALYLLMTGDIWHGITLIAFGVLVIGLVDNILRPILVGKDTQMPDYIVLISTLGGIVAFGLSGFILGPLIAVMFIAVWDIFSTGAKNPERS